MNIDAFKALDSCPVTPDNISWLRDAWRDLCKRGVFDSTISVLWAVLIEHDLHSETMRQLGFTPEEVTSLRQMIHRAHSAIQTSQPSTSRTADLFVQISCNTIYES